MAFAGAVYFAAFPAAFFLWAQYFFIRRETAFRATPLILRRFRFLIAPASPWALTAALRGRP